MGAGGTTLKLSILIPVYNERTLVERSLRAVLDAPLPERLERELVVVDDCSTDGTSAILERLAKAEPRIRLHRHAVNQGKGAAVRTAIQNANGDFCLIQDADLEYDPRDYPALVGPLLDGQADAVFGSRYLSPDRRRVLPYWHSRMNGFLTWVSNIFSNLDLTDMETCYKAFRTDLLKTIPIRSNRFGIEPEITMKVAKRRLRIYEVPISYHGRTYEEGKKIGWRDGVKALGAIVYFRLVDDLYTETYGRAYLNNLNGTPQFVSWVVSLVRPHVGDTVMELHAGIGTITGRLMSRRTQYMAVESNPLYFDALRNRFLRTPSVEVSGEVPEMGEFDTVLCLNLLESEAAPEAVVQRAAALLKPGGNLVVVAQHRPGLHGTLDQALGHRRRFDRESIEALFTAAGLTMESGRTFNRAAAPVWWMASKILGWRVFPKLMLKAFDKTMGLWRRLDAVLPWAGASVLAVARKPGQPVIIESLELSGKDRAPWQKQSL
jgi:glycosyltransferase involved in cell wall biosynthesis/phospholipid N-methyltransferase